MSTRGSSPSAKKAPKNRLTEISAARKIAFTILLAIERGNGHSDDLLRGQPVNALSTPDRHLATALVLGVLRWQILLDQTLRPFLSRPNAKLDAEVVIALRLAALQFLHMDRIPARAAIDESVELTKQSGHRFASAMVNAVLRKLAAAPHPRLSEDTAEEAALANAHPAWMVERWARTYGLETARALCRHGQQPPSITIRLCTPAAEAGLIQSGIALQMGSLLSSARTVVAGDLAASTALATGSVRPQDEGSQLVAEIAAAQLGTRHGRILDACAAPGGKTLILAERCPQASIVACEASKPRLEMLRQRLAAYANRIECHLCDVTQLNAESEFDLVLADVPCSGTGTLGRNPEIRHRLRPDDLERQAERQRGILTAALQVVKPGGRVLYSTCSLEPEENEQVVSAVLAAHPDMRAVSVRASLETLSRLSILSVGALERLQNSITPEGALRLIPGQFSTDGFFVAILERSA